MTTVQIIMISIWVVVLLITLLLEFESQQLVTIWFSVGSILALILAAFNVHYIWQIASFVVLSTVLVLATRPLSRRFMRREIVATNIDSIIGKQGTIITDVSLDVRGEVKVEGRIWVAFVTTNIQIEKGIKVVVMDVEGNKLLVEPIDKEEKR